MSLQFLAGVNTAQANVTPWNAAGVPCTMAAWCYADTATPNMGIGKFWEPGSGDQHTVQVDGTHLVGISVDQGINSQTIVSTATFATLTYFHAMGVFPDQATRQIYLNAVQSAGVTGVAPTNPNQFVLSHGSTGVTWNGRLASWALWKEQLNAAEIIALSKGFSPRRIRPQSLVAFLPLVRNVFDFKGATLTSGALPSTAMPHHRQYGA